MCAEHDESKAAGVDGEPIEEEWRDEEAGELPRDRADGNDGAPTTSSSPPPSKKSRRTGVPLVHLSLENITYAPVSRTAGGASSSSRKSWCLCGFGRSSSSSSSIGAKSRKTVLHSVSASVSPHRLSAWMGPSGSGKTSLLTVAAGLISSQDDLIDGGRIAVNGEAGKVPKRLVGVVWQDDLLLPNLTVEETVTFAARLKTPESAGEDEVRSVVDEALARLGLDKVRHSLIGGTNGPAAARGISGGERKRVSVAVELVARPSVLLLDEPTSGLDSTSAQNLMSTLKDLAGSGHSIAAVVHQPRTAIYELFDDLLLLSGGRVVYSGPPSGARGCLEACPGVSPLPAQTGIADWIMDVITEDEKREGGGALSNHWMDYSARSGSRKGTVESRVECSAGSGDGTCNETNGGGRKPPLVRRMSTLAELRAEPKFKTSLRTQLRVLTSRSMKQNRGERITRVALYFTLVYLLLTCILWWRLPDDTNRVYERNSLMFFLIIAQSNGIVVSSMTTFSRERALLSRERAKKMYGVLPYFLAKTASDMTHTVLLPTLYGCATYWVANLRPTASAFFSFFAIFYLTVSTAQSTGLFLSVTIPSLPIGLMLAPAINLFLMILGGFYVPLNNLHPAIEWASWLSFARYGFSALIVNEFGGRDVPCADGPVSVTVGDSGECPLPGEEVIASMGISGSFTNKWANVGVLVGMQIFLRAACYVMLRRAR